MKYYIQHKMMCMWSYLLLLSVMLTRHEAEYSSRLNFVVCTLYSSCLILLLNIFLYESMYVYTSVSSSYFMKNLSLNCKQKHFGYAYYKLHYQSGWILFPKKWADSIKQKNQISFRDEKIFQSYAIGLKGYQAIRLM